MKIIPFDFAADLNSDKIRWYFFILMLQNFKSFIKKILNYSNYIDFVGNI